MQCEYCGGPINSKPKVLEFANFRDSSAVLAAKTSIRKSRKAGYDP